MLKHVWNNSKLAAFIFLPFSLLAQKETTPKPTPAAQRLSGFDQRKKLDENSLVSN